MTKCNDNKDAGQRAPGGIATRDPEPPTTKPHHRNVVRNTKPSADHPTRQVAEGLDYRFLRSRPRVIGPGSLRRARPRRSEYNLNTHPYGLNNNRSTGTLQTLAVAR
jgi:hypothetical protein